MGVLLAEARRGREAVVGRRSEGGVLLMATTRNELREEVREKYAAAATAGGCGSGDDGCCTGGDFGPALYDVAQRAELPGAAVLASLGCGNPTAVADLRDGERVLDLGSGGGSSVIRWAGPGGPPGHA